VPASGGDGGGGFLHHRELKGEYTTHRVTWNSTGVTFQSLHGHHDDNSNQFADWLYQPQNPASYIPQKAMPVDINLWLFQGQPPGMVSRSNSLFAPSSSRRLHDEYGYRVDTLGPGKCRRGSRS